MQANKQLVSSGNCSLKYICDPLCENPAKVIFVWLAVFY